MKTNYEADVMKRLERIEDQIRGAQFGTMHS